MYMVGDFLMKSTQVFDSAESIKSRSMSAGIYTVLICNILIHLHLRSVFSITKSLYLTHKSLISLLNNIYRYLIYKKLV